MFGYLIGVGLVEQVRRDWVLGQISIVIAQGQDRKRMQLEV